MRGTGAIGRAVVVLAIAGVMVSAGAAEADPGVLDTSLSGNGKQTVGRAGFDLEAEAMAIEHRGGEILLAGVRRDDNTGETDFAVVRLRPSGTKDDTFGGDGLVTTGVGSARRPGAPSVEPFLRGGEPIADER